MTATKPTRKDIAEFFRLGLRVGACNLSTIVRWADEVITSEPSPPFAFFDLSTCESQPVSTALSLLIEVPGDRTPDLAVHMLLGHCYRLTRSHALNVLDVLVPLFRVSRVESFPDDIWSELVRQEDAFADARDGVYGSLSEVQDSFTEYLSRFQHYASP